MNLSEVRVRQRIQQCDTQQQRTLRAIRVGVPRSAEPDPVRAIQRLEAQAQLGELLTVTPYRRQPAEAGEAAAEAIWGATVDFVGVAFLERGMNAARTVARIEHRDLRPQGSGFLIAPGLLITNNHVLDKVESCAEFIVELDFEVDAFGRQRDISRFELAPLDFFLTDHRDDLDYTVVAIGRRIDGPQSIDSFGYSPLSGASNKHSLGEVANIVQHPNGRFKEVVLRENRLVSRLSHVLHYAADTEPGSSGSPVFNNQWQVIALHHWGGPWRQDASPDGVPVPRFVNEGIRISAIVDKLRAHLSALEPSQQRRLNNLLTLGEASLGLPKDVSAKPPTDPRTGIEVRADGTAVWRIPIEIAIRVADQAAPAALSGGAVANSAGASGAPEPPRNARGSTSGGA